MDKESKKNTSAIIVLHEIYGVNRFIKKQCRKFREAGYDVFCPDMLGRQPFSYEEPVVAYDYFIKNIGFEVYKEISVFTNQLKEKYDNVFIIGYSVGATIAWRCCENPPCSGIIACYGSRIRDYTDLNPTCPTLLLFANEDSFDVGLLVRQLRGKRHLTIIRLDAVHGFMDSCSKHFNIQQAKFAGESINSFLNEFTSADQ